MHYVHGSFFECVFYDFKVVVRDKHAAPRVRSRYAKRARRGLGYYEQASNAN